MWFYNYHVVDYADGVGDGAGLESHVCHVGYHFSDGDVAVGVVVEFDAGDLVDAIGDGGGGFEDGVCGESWGLGVWLAVGNCWGHDGWCGCETADLIQSTFVRF